MQTIHPASVQTGLIGYGTVASTIHAPLIADTPGMNLAAIYSSKGDAVRERWPQAFVSASVDEVLARPDIALVVIATPNNTHFDLAQRALLAGKNVVVDKPFTVTLDQARALQRIAQEQGRLISVFHNRRWDADFLTLRQLIREDKLGHIHFMESQFNWFAPQVRDSWMERAGVGTGQWYDLSPHLLDQSLQLFGWPDSVQGTLEMQRGGAAAVDFFRVVLRYGSGLQVALQSGLLHFNSGPRYVVHGKKATYVKYGLDPQEDALQRGEVPSLHSNWGSDRDGFLSIGGAAPTAIPTLPGDWGTYYRAIRDALVGDVPNRAPNPVPVEQAIAVMKLVEFVATTPSLAQGVATPLAQ